MGSITMEIPSKIVLRPFELNDVDDFMQWAGDNEVTKYCQWNTYTCKEEAMNFLKQVIDTHPWYRAVCVNGHPIGSIYVMLGTDNYQRRGEIGYALSAKYWGLGIATVAVKMAVSCVFEESPYLDRVEGLVFAKNKASQRVFEKAGFIREGLLRKYFFVKGKSRDIVVYSLVSRNVVDGLSKRKKHTFLGLSGFSGYNET